MRIFSLIYIYKRSKSRTPTGLYTDMIEYSARGKKSSKMRPHRKLAQFLRETVGEAKWQELEDGRRLYVVMLDELHAKTDPAAQAEQGASSDGDSHRFGGTKRRFTVEEEMKAKQILDLPEIERYVDDWRAIDQLESAEAGNEIARQEHRQLPHSAKALQALRDKVARYHDVRRSVDERYQQLRQRGAGQARSTLQDDQGEDDPPHPPPNPPEAHVQAERRRRRPSAQGTRHDPLPDQPLPILSNPSIVAAKLQSVGNEWQNRLRSIHPPFRGSSNAIIPAFTASLARTAVRAPVKVLILLRVSGTKKSGSS